MIEILNEYNERERYEDTVENIDYKLYIYVEDGDADEFCDYINEHREEFNSQVFKGDEDNLELIEDSADAYTARSFIGRASEYNGKYIATIIEIVKKIDVDVVKQVYPATYWEPRDMYFDWSFRHKSDDKMYVGKEFTFGGFKCKIIDSFWDYDEIEDQLLYR